MTLLFLFAPLILIWIGILPFNHLPILLDNLILLLIKGQFQSNILMLPKKFKVPWRVLFSFWNFLVIFYQILLLVIKTRKARSWNLFLRRVRVLSELIVIVRKVLWSVNLRFKSIINNFWFLLIIKNISKLFFINYNRFPLMN